MPLIDPTDNAQVVVTAFHHNVHAGRSFVCDAVYSGVPDAEFARMTMVIPAGHAVHTNIGIAVEAKARIFVKDVSSFSNGIQFAPVNRNFSSSLASSVAVFIGGSLEAVNSTFSEVLFPGGTKSKATGGVGTSFTELVLPGGIWTIDVQNFGQAAKDIGIEANWYEPQIG